MTFKVRLLLGAAAPLVFTLPAVAQVTISTATTDAGPDRNRQQRRALDITIASGGSITPTTAGTTAVTINSNNDVINNGAISFTNLNDTVGVRILPGLTGSYTGSGSISLLEDYTRADTDSDTDTDELDGPLAQGSNRYGILLEPGGTFTGDIRIDNTNNVPQAQIVGGAITVEGNNSAGVSLQSDLIGSYIQNGIVTVIGTNARRRRPPRRRLRQRPDRRRSCHHRHGRRGRHTALRRRRRPWRRRSRGSRPRRCRRRIPDRRQH